MTRDNDKTALSPQDEDLQRRPRRHPWITALKVVCWIVGIVVVLLCGAIWFLSVYLSPQRITKLIEDESGKYLDAEIHIGRLDYKVWKNYPWLDFQVDSVFVISKSLHGVSPEQQRLLPAYADSLASVIKIEGKINLHSLLRKKVVLRDILIERPSANIVMVTDSVTNFNILKEKLPDNTKMPDIDLDISEVRIVAPVDFNFFSLQEDARASLDVENFYLEKKSGNSYRIGFDGLANGRWKEYSFPENIPIKFTTDVTLVKPDLDVTLQDLALDYAGLRLEVGGEISTHRQGVDLRDVKVNLSIDDVFTFLGSLPDAIAEKITIPDGISGKIPVSLRAELLAPYQITPEKFKEFSLHDLPRFFAVVDINDARLHLAPPGTKPVDADDVYLILECNFDPDNSENTVVNIAEVRLNGEGISLEGKARLSNLTGEQQPFEGNVTFSSPLMETLSYFMPGLPVKVAGTLHGDLAISGNAVEVGQKGLKDLALQGDIKSNSITVSSGKSGSVKMKNLVSDFRGSLPSYPINNNYAGTKFGFDLKADSVTTKANGINLLLGKLDMQLEAADTVSGNPDPFGSLRIKARSLNVRSGGNQFIAGNLDLKAKGSLNSSPAPDYPAVDLDLKGDEKIIESRVDHTPLLLEYEGGGILQTIMGMVNVDVNLQVAKGKFKTPAYLYPVEFAGLEMSTDLNDVKFFASDLTLARTGCLLSGEIEGLRPFMTSYSPTMLKASANIHFSNVDIDQLSWGYYGALLESGVPRDSVFYLPPMLPMTAADSVCVVIPRNIDADIRLFSDAAECLGYKFAPLSTEIRVKDGAALLHKLTVTTPYCTGIVDWRYSTSDLGNIFMDLDVQVKDFRFENFYTAFPSLVEKTPELKDFTGEVNADISGRFRMFPDMFMNPQSLSGNFDIKAGNLKFARQGKIEKITHLMLIEGHEPIAIQNITITGGFHDDLLQVNPFKIRFDDYQLGFVGGNNLAGQMYYHLALEKSPFHLPFGVNVMGRFKHPEIRVGGTKLDDYRTELLSSDLSSNINVNIMAWLKHGWLIFVQEAAKYEEGK